jgi:TP901 family phage tail tape measure protein
MNPQLQQYIQLLEALARQGSRTQAEIQSLADALRDIGTGGSNVTQLSNSVNALNSALGNTSASSQYIQMMQNLATQATATAQAVANVNRVAGQAGAGAQAGAAAASNALPDFKNRFTTIGIVSPESLAAMGNATSITQKISQATQELQKQYQTAGVELKNFAATIDQTTGKMVVQAEAERDLGNGLKQHYTVQNSVNPFSGETSMLSDAQQAFVDQAGGVDRAKQMLSQYGMEIRNVTGFYKDLGSEAARFSVVGTDGLSTAMGAFDEFGNATLHASRNAQTFFQNVGRDTVKVVEWAASYRSVYTAMNSVIQAAGEMKDIQNTMTDIAIATGTAADQLQRYYDAALSVANETGSDVTNTLEAQSKAYRAAASEGDRFTAANTLLRDSLILAKLGSMDETEAIDTLIASLRQSGMGLTEGTQLLDKWIRTTQNAGVSLKDLSTSFAITSDVADTVGVDIDHLNGIIAVLAEKTTLSSTEIGNAVRTMFANITSDEATKTLGEFGISVRDVNGNMRDWLDITQNIVDLMNSGLLNDEQINKLANALGGGSRRGPQLIALWKSFGEVNNIASQSMNANGEAAKAMDTKLATLTASVNELHNAFNELAQTLGFKGGFLEMATKGIEIVTGLVKGIDSLAKSFGNSTSAIAAFAAGYTLLSKVMGTSNLAATTLGGLPNAYGNTGLGSYLGQKGDAGTVQAGVQGVLGPSMAIVGGEIARGIASGESWDRIGSKAGAAITGAFVGNMILPGAGGLDRFCYRRWNYSRYTE